VLAIADNPVDDHGGGPVDNAPEARWEQLLADADGERMISEALGSMDVDDLAAALRRVSMKSRNTFLERLTVLRPDVRSTY